MMNRGDIISIQSLKIQCTQKLYGPVHLPRAHQVRITALAIASDAMMVRVLLILQKDRQQIQQG
jgi:hypothetical protein